jgi:hypothetical protein
MKCRLLVASFSAWGRADGSRVNDWTHCSAATRAGSTYTRHDQRTCAHRAQRAQHARLGTSPATACRERMPNSACNRGGRYSAKWHTGHDVIPHSGHWGAAPAVHQARFKDFLQKHQARSLCPVA